MFNCISQCLTLFQISCSNVNGHPQWGRVLAAALPCSACLSAGCEVVFHCGFYFLSNEEGQKET